MTEQNTETEEGPRSFLHFLESLAEGEAKSVLSAELHALCEALQSEAEARRAKVAGTLTLTLNVTVEGKLAAIGYAVTTKKPSPKRAASVMWLTRGGNLTTQNPQQQQLPGIREVPTKQQPSREVVGNEEIKEA